MYAVIRRYTDVPQLIRELQSKHEDVSTTMGDVPGFIAYHAIRDGAQLATVTICKDRDSAEETSRRAAKWVSDNMTLHKVRSPDAIECAQTSRERGGRTFAKHDGHGIRRIHVRDFHPSRSSRNRASAGATGLISATGRPRTVTITRWPFSDLAENGGQPGLRLVQRIGVSHGRIVYGLVRPVDVQLAFQHREQNRQ